MKVTFRGSNVGGEGEHVRPVRISGNNAASHLDGRENLSQQAADKVTDEAIAGFDIGHISFNLPHCLHTNKRSDALRDILVAIANV